MSGNERKPYAHKNFYNYDRCSLYEKGKLEKGYRRLKEYEHYYLYGKYNENGEMLYKECFSKFDVDGVRNTKKLHGPIFRH